MRKLQHVHFALAAALAASATLAAAQGEGMSGSVGATTGIGMTADPSDAGGPARTTNWPRNARTGSTATDKGTHALQAGPLAGTATDPPAAPPFGPPASIGLSVSSPSSPADSAHAR